MLHSPHTFCTFDFPFVGIHPMADIYAIFDFDPMHVLSLGRSKLLKECFVLMLSDEMESKSVVQTMSRVNKTFRELRILVLQALNKFLKNYIIQISWFRAQL